MLWWQIFILLVTFLSYFILCPQALSKHLSTEWPTMFILQFHFASWYKTLFKNHSHVPYRLFNPLTANYNRNLAICNCETTDQENIGCSFRNQTMLSKPLSLISNMEKLALIYKIKDYVRSLTLKETKETFLWPYEYTYI